MYPLRFQPLLRRAIWGGRRLGEYLGKPVGELTDCAESWEVVDHGSEQSIVSHGPLRGQSLQQLMRSAGNQLVGAKWHRRVNDSSWPDQLRGRFPLLFKFLDAQRPLSIQVHPNDQQAKAQRSPDLGKTEAWYVIDAGNESLIYAGLKRDVTVHDLQTAIADNDLPSCVHQFRPQPGDCIFIPAGTVHSIGGDILMAEIQQSSDTTFRLFDWNRTDASGQPRSLHIDEALAVIDFERGPIEPIRDPEKPSDDGRQLLVACDKFELAKFHLQRAAKFGGDGRMRIIAVINGALKVVNSAESFQLNPGGCTLLPSSMPEITLQPESTVEFLSIELPDASTND